MNQEQQDYLVLLREVFAVIKQNGEIFIELRKILENIKDSVAALPKDSEYRHLREFLERIEEDIKTLITSDIRNSDLPSQILKIVVDLTTILHTVNKSVQEMHSAEAEKKLSRQEISEMKKKLDAFITNHDIWIKVRLPFIMGAISLVIFAVGFFTTLVQFNKDFNQILEKNVIPIISKIDGHAKEYEELKKSLQGHIDSTPIPQQPPTHSTPTPYINPSTPITPSRKP